MNLPDSTREKENAAVVLVAQTVSVGTNALAVAEPIPIADELCMVARAAEIRNADQDISQDTSITSEDPCVEAASDKLEDCQRKRKAVEKNLCGETRSKKIRQTCDQVPSLDQELLIEDTNDETLLKDGKLFTSASDFGKELRAVAEQMLKTGESLINESLIFEESLKEMDAERVRLDAEIADVIKYFKCNLTSPESDGEMETEQQKEQESRVSQTVQNVNIDQESTGGIAPALVRSELKILLDSRVNKDGLFVCELCGKKYKGEKYFDEHCEAHLGADIKCEECGKKYHTIASFKIHSRGHREGFATCGYCNLPFDTVSACNVHEKKHMGLIYYCKSAECDKSFRSISARNEHSKYDHWNVHEQGARPVFHCEKCVDQNYDKPSGLYNHKSKKHPTPRK